MGFETPTAAWLSSLDEEGLREGSMLESGAQVPVVTGPPISEDGRPECFSGCFELVWDKVYGH